MSSWRRELRFYLHYIYVIMTVWLVLIRAMLDMWLTLSTRLQNQPKLFIYATHQIFVLWKTNTSEVELLEGAE